MGRATGSRCKSRDCRCRYARQALLGCAVLAVPIYVVASFHNTPRGITKRCPADCNIETHCCRQGGSRNHQFHGNFHDDSSSIAALIIKGNNTARHRLIRGRPLRAASFGPGTPTGAIFARYDHCLRPAVSPLSAVLGVMGSYNPPRMTAVASGRTWLPGRQSSAGLIFMRSARPLWWWRDQ